MTLLQPSSSNIILRPESEFTASVNLLKCLTPAVMHITIFYLVRDFSTDPVFISDAYSTAYYSAPHIQTVKKLPLNNTVI